LQRLTLAKRTAPLFFLAAVAFYLYGLGHLPFIGPDEPRYAQVAREMYERGDLITPTLGGHTWFEKPALLYWMMIAGFRTFGVSEWSARLGPALCGLLTIFLIYGMGRRVERASGSESGLSGLGLWAGACAASSVGLIVFSRGASFDIVVTMTVTLSLVSFFATEIDDKRHSAKLVCFYAAIGASLLAKGLVGIVVPFGIIGLYFILRRQWPGKRLLLSLLWGIPLALAVSALWYGPVIAKHGSTFVDEFFIQHHFARYISNKYHHPQPFYFYIPVVILLALPWTAFLIAALLRARRWEWRAGSVESRFRIFALAWMLAPILFFSASGSKLPGYILPALPGAAFLIGERLSRFVHGEEGGAWLGVTGALLIGLAVAGIVFSRISQIPLGGMMVVVAPLVVGGLVTLLLKEARGLRAEVVCSAMFMSMALAINGGVNRIAAQESVRDLMLVADARGEVSTPVFYMLTDDRTAEFYAGGRLAYKPDGEPFRFDGANEVAAAAAERGGRALVLVPTEWTNQLTDYSAIKTELIANNGVLTLALVTLR
jgi:4-amino-4-deoxy-L-arabinose transferase-like glycosyltransferase